MDHDKERSWLRLQITIAIEWRLVIAVTLLLLVLLGKEYNTLGWLATGPGF